ncbi:zeta toxin family protein [Microcystis elabens FACHB-917]|nr:zeta toxin family protein [Microcystis elabens FACHB-917]
MFAGPNGSGKSVLKAVLPLPLLGVYLNPDEIEASIRHHGFLDLAAYGVSTTAAALLPTFTGSELLRSAGLLEPARRLRLAGGRLVFAGVEVNAYFASVVADVLRQHLLERRASFTCETVMSHPGKVALLEQAQRLIYRTYLYFVATDDPEINVSRVRNRVGLGGHPVPEDKIISRYHRSLAHLLEAIKHTNRAYIFDNSTDSADPKLAWIAEITDGRRLELKTDRIPAWFNRAVMEKIA